MCVYVERESTLLRASLIDLRLVADHAAGRLFSKRRRGRHKAVRRLLRHRDARRCQSLNGGRRRSILRVKQETDGHPHGGRQHRHLQPQRPSPGETHPSAGLRSFLYAPAAIDTFPRCDYRTSLSCGLEMSCYLSNILPPLFNHPRVGSLAVWRRKVRASRLVPPFYAIEDAN